MSFIKENIKKWLEEEIYSSGNPRLFLWYIKDALDEIEEEMDEELAQQMEEAQ